MGHMTRFRLRTANSLRSRAKRAMLECDGKLESLGPGPEGSPELGTWLQQRSPLRRE